jgi:hypothetical protein
VVRGRGLSRKVKKLKRALQPAESGLQGRSGREISAQERELGGKNSLTEAISATVERGVDAAGRSVAAAA